MQGWTNDKTWCVAMTIDNTKHHLDTVLYFARNKNNQGIVGYCWEIRGDIFNMATWAWPEAVSKQSLNMVNWNEIFEHYQTKINEGA